MPKHEMILPINDAEWLYIVVDEPLSQPKALFVLCHGLTGDRVGPQKILVNWAREFADNGYLVVRFDFRGSGDSSGLFSSTTFSTMQRDIEEVIAWSRKKFSFPYLVLGGLSLGAVPAVMASSQQKDCRAMFLISSDVVDCPQFTFPSYPAPIRNGQFFLHHLFYAEREAIKPRDILKKNQFPTFLFYGVKDEKLCRAARELQQIRVIPFAVDESDHLFESLKARDFVAKQILEQLKRVFAK